ncbi:MAG: tetratricopeptide repeat protein [bacterium]
MPFKYIFESDGYNILKDAKQLGLSKLKLIKELFYGILYGIRYLILGSSNTRQESNNNLIINAYEYVRKGDFKKGLSELEKVIQENPNDPELLNNIAWCYSELGVEIDKAIIFAQKAIKLNSNEATYWDTLGWCYLKKGDITHAKYYITQAIKIDLHNSIFQNHLKEIDRYANG